MAAAKSPSDHARKLLILYDVNCDVQLDQKALKWGSVGCTESIIGGLGFKSDHQ